MSLYTTGEIAKLAEVSVRTVQFYDRKGILPPSQLSEGRRRLYSQEDLGKLQRICLWKTMGLSLEAIKGILESQNADKVLELLLEQQPAINLSSPKEKKRRIKPRIKIRCKAKVRERNNRARCPAGQQK